MVSLLTIGRILIAKQFGGALSWAKEGWPKPDWPELLPPGRSETQWMSSCGWRTTEVFTPKEWGTHMSEWQRLVPWPTEVTLFTVRACRRNEGTEWLRHASTTWGTNLCTEVGLVPTEGRSFVHFQCTRIRSNTGVDRGLDRSLMVINRKICRINRKMVNFWNEFEKGKSHDNILLMQNYAGI